MNGLVSIDGSGVSVSVLGQALSCKTWSSGKTVKHVLRLKENTNEGIKDPKIRTYWYLRYSQTVSLPVIRGFAR